MARIRKLPDVLKTHPNWKPGWNVIEEQLSDGTKLVTGLQSPRFGRVERVVVCKDDGTPVFDQYQIEEGPVNSEGKRTPGSIVVPYFNYEGYEDGAVFYRPGIYVGLLDRIRELVVNPETNEQGEYHSLELPRGFGRLGEVPEETAIRELGEETSKVAKKLVRLGRGINPNTAFYVIPGVPTFAAEVDSKITSHLKPDSREPILRCKFSPYEDVRRRVGDGEIYCGVTLAGLMLFDSYLEQNSLK